MIALSMSGPSGSLRVLAMLEAETISGSAKSVVEFANEAAKAEYVELEIMKFSRGGQQENSLTQAIAALAVPLHIVEERYAGDPSLLPKLRNLVRARKPDVIWSNSVKSHFLVRAAELHREAGWLAFHHGYTTTNAKMRVYNQLDRWSLRAADRVLTVCEPFARTLNQNGVPASRVHVQHMPVRPFERVPLGEEELRRRLNLGKSLVLLSIGRLSAEKGHVDLIRAFALIRRKIDAAIPLRLLVVGEGPERGRIEQAARDLGVSEQVSLEGHRDEVPAYYGIADIFLLPSHSEGSPNVLLEAMVASVPIVATRVGGVPEIATHEQDALLVPAQNPPALASAAVRILRDPELRSRLGATAQSAAERHAPKEYFHAVAGELRAACIRTPAHRNYRQDIRLR